MISRCAVWKVGESFEGLYRRGAPSNREVAEQSQGLLLDYGAIQMGVHRFIERGAPTLTIAKFIHLWQRKDGGWRLTRVLSFDHRAAAN